MTLHCIKLFPADHQQIHTDTIIDDDIWHWLHIDKFDSESKVEIGISPKDYGSVGKKEMNDWAEAGDVLFLTE